MNNRVHVSSTMWRIKNIPCNSTSYSDNALRLLVLVVGILYWGLQVMSSFSIWGCVLKGYFERGIYVKGQIAPEGHWRLQSWTLTRMLVFGQPILHYPCSRCEQIPCEDDCRMRVRSKDICIREHVAMVFNTYAYDQHGLKTKARWLYKYGESFG